MSVGPLIEEITDEEADRFTSVTQSHAAESNGTNVYSGERGTGGTGGDLNSNNFGPSTVNDPGFVDSLQILKQNPEMIRQVVFDEDALHKFVAEASHGTA